MAQLLCLATHLPCRSVAHPTTNNSNFAKSASHTRCPSRTAAHRHDYDNISLSMVSPPDLLCKLACTAMAVALLSFASMSAFARDSSSTPFSQSQVQNMQLGLLNGIIRPCPSDINPNCISTTSRTATYAIPWTIPPEASENAARKILSAVLATQKGARVLVMEDTPTGQFLQIEVPGIFGRDIMEFLVKGDVVTYRSLAQKVVYVYPFTTPITDFGAQEKRLKALEDELGWTVYSWNSTDFDDQF